MFSFVLKASGGESGHLLKETESYVRTKAPHTELRPEIFELVSKDIKGANQRVLTRHALIKIGFIHPGTVEKNHCTAILAPGEEKDLPELMMLRMRGIVDKLSEPLQTTLAVKHFMHLADMRILSNGIKLGLYKDDPKQIKPLMHNLIHELQGITKVGIPFEEFADCKEEPAKNDKPAASAAVDPPAILVCLT